ncbi:flagellar FliL protein [Salinihabitans flavidus]|uniref:Flagellar protein FliL n=1 Tax=Salinihabitans flavidus TaxID=569882 RepID=A0A1H8LS60_9RHOB|nr:flagellar basal body-associated FliL family protein [Salinihabitans flavidus]SEO07698.1 flagellar FliL protein [Salinihabitans flavidus]
MAEAATSEENGGKAGRNLSRRSLLTGLILAIVGGGGGFYAVYSGALSGMGMFADGASVGAVEESPNAIPTEPLPDMAFVPIETIIVSLRGDSLSRHLKFRAQLEVPSEYRREVESVLPRIVDVLNGYLGALEPGDIERTAALTRLRAQMLRRIQIVTGQARVRDLLIMEFVLN